MTVPKAFELIEETPLHRGFFDMLRLRFRHTLFRGGWSTVVDRELLHRGRCVAVIPYDPVADTVVLIEQFRVGAMKAKANPWLLEIVAGAVEDGETPEDVAHREALEEAGCVLRELIRIGEFFTSPGGYSEIITLFCGLLDSRGIGGVHGLEEEEEDIRVEVVSFEEAMLLLQRERIDSAIPIIALQWLALNRDRLRQPLDRWETK